METPKGLLKLANCEDPDDRRIINETYHQGLHGLLRPNKTISVFRVTGLKILGRVGTQNLFDYIFSGKKI